jgi:uracil-DNA glycosylase
MSDSIKMESSWQQLLHDEFSKSYFIAIKQTLLHEQNSGKIIYPPSEQMFAAFNHTPIQQIKVVILGQDPYHGAGQANGLCFSVNDGVKLPPSLVNIFKEVQADTGNELPTTGNLERWADQGVFLLNSILSVRDSEPGAHKDIGWQLFTDQVIRAVSLHCNHVVFMLWGNFARSKKTFIDASKHLVLEAAHPSPFSAYNGFFGCKHFSQANQFLEQHGIAGIRW